MIRFATEKDAGEILKIYAPYIEKTAITFEYEVPSLSEFSGRIAEIQKKYMIAKEYCCWILIR